LEASGKALKELRKKVGLIFQYPEHQLFEETVYKDITFGLQKIGLSEDEIKRRVFHVIDLLGISPELLEKSPFELSGGQKRRAAIAGVLVMEPEVLILDEPTAGLDPRGSHEVFEILKKLNTDDGTTIIIISHNMDDIAALCHRIAVMHNGELKMCDTAMNIFSRSDDLKSCGLDIPKVTELFQILRSEGYNIPSPVLTVREAGIILNRLLKPISEAGGVKYDQ
jgi:energy-coupling factor transport system ATP-binding protein